MSTNETNDISKITISIVLIIKNGEEYMRYLDEIFGNQQEQKYDYMFYIYENNSTDKTKMEIENFFLKRPDKCKYLMENVSHNLNLSGISIERGTYMAKLRNKLKDFHGTLDSTYTIIIDCDVLFSHDIIDEALNVFKTHPNVAAVTAFDVCWYQYVNHNSIHYYDTLALITENNYRNTQCIFSSCISCRKDRALNKICDEKILLSNNKIINVNSAFGGFLLIKTDIYNQVKWENNDVCEHHSFCKNIKKFGNIVINSNINVITTVPAIRNYNAIQLSLVQFNSKSDSVTQNAAAYLNKKIIHKKIIQKKRIHKKIHLNIIYN